MKLGFIKKDRNQKKQGRTGKKKLLAVAAGLLIVGVSVTGIFNYEKANTAGTEAVYKETTAKKGNLMTGVSESGSVTIGTVSQEIDYEGTADTSSESSSSVMGGSMGSSSGSSLGLEVEEVYVTVGQSVSENEPILKISEDSIAEVREELEEAVSNASASLSETKTNSAKQKLNADYSYNTTVVNASVAEENYNAAIKELQDAVDDAAQAAEEQYAICAYYQEIIDGGQTGYADVLEEETEKYEKLKAQLTKAQNEYATKSIEAKKTYQEAMLSYQNADAQYSVDINGVNTDISDAQQTLEDAKEALEEFEAFIGDGIIYAEYSGMITEIGYEAGDTLTTGTAIASYTDETAVSMTVSVSEEDISGIAVGDAVSISLNAYEDVYFDGVVSNVDVTSSSGSSTVSYNVTVLFTGETDKVYADMTGTVTFVEEEVTDVIFVSKKAVITEDGQTFVKIKKDDDTIEKVQVTTGFTDGVYVEIKTGVEEGNTVLIESQVTA